MRENNNSYRYVRNSAAADYQYGSAAPAYTPQRRQPGSYEAPQPRKAPQKARNFSITGTIIVLCAIGFLAYVMVNYVRVQSELTGTIKTVADKQVTLNKVTSDNDELYSRIISSVDLEHIEAVARGELGMTYATEGQIITYTRVGNDYMRKVDNGK